MPYNPQDVPLYRPVNSPFAKKWGATTPSGTPVDDLARRVEKQLGRTQPVPADRPAGSPYARQYGPSDPAGVAQSLATLRAAFSPGPTRVRKAIKGPLTAVYDGNGKVYGVLDADGNFTEVTDPTAPTPKTPPAAPAAPAAPAVDPVAAAVQKARAGTAARRQRVAKQMARGRR